MPTYPYACTECGHQFEQHQSFSDDALTTCPECGGKLRKVWGSVGVVFKGSGFYRTDSRGSGKSTDTASGATKADASNGATKADSGSAAKSSGSDTATKAKSTDSGGSSASSTKNASSGSSSGAA